MIWCIIIIGICIANSQREQNDIARLRSQNDLAGSGLILNKD